jgi:hypothetical protein
MAWFLVETAVITPILSGRAAAYLACVAAGAGLIE